MRTALVLFGTLLALCTALAGPTGGQSPPAAAGDLKPVVVAVVDRDTGEPVTSFTYQATYDAPGRKSPPNGDEWKAVLSPDGRFEIQTPRACRLFVMVKSPDYIGGYPGVDEFVIKSDDKPRRVVVRLRPGITVRGTVFNSRTKKPIAGASVAPVIHLLPIWAPDEDKEVETGADGFYEVRGVDPALGVSASHADFIHDLAFPDGKTTGPNHDIFLKPKPRVTIPVNVVDSSGAALDGVTAADSNGKLATSGKDGRVELESPDLVLGVTFHKIGFIDRKIEAGEIRRELPNPAGLVVMMERSIALTGRLVAPDGGSVGWFTIAAGPGELPSRADSVRRDVRGLDGRFHLDLANEGTTWVGVSAPGFAAWEGWVDVQRGGRPLDVHLSPGVTVTARVVVPEALKSGVKARLVPRRDKSDIGGLPSEPPAEALPTRTSALSALDTLRFEHIRPDRYQLIIECPGGPKTVLAVDVPGAGVDLGVIHIDVPAATGRIEGQVWHPPSKGGGIWAFADGNVGGFRFKGGGGVDREDIEFQADANGHFTVDRVPAGLVTVGFPYHYFDVVSEYTWSALVVDGQTTVVRAFELKEPRALTMAFAIGDRSKAQYESGTGLGASRKVDNVTVSSRMFSDLEKKGATPREPMFRVELLPLSKDPLAFAKPDWEQLDAQRKLVLADVGPGTYRLRVYDWLGLRDLESGPLFDHEVVVPAAGRREVSVALGAGCITGKIPATKDDFERRVEVTAVAKQSGTPSRRAHCDSDGNFCVRYLSPGTYTVFIHDPKSGFFRLDDVHVPPGVVDVGERTLSAGATISGAIQFVRPSRLPGEVRAVGPKGVSVRQRFEVYSSFDRVEIAGLWPGRWTVSALRGDEVFAIGEVDVEGTGTFQVTLATGGAKKR